jgi:hypothetical protein
MNRFALAKKDNDQAMLDGTLKPPTMTRTR